jgi:hypothetical protein
LFVGMELYHGRLMAATANVTIRIKRTAETEKYITRTRLRCSPGIPYFDQWWFKTTLMIAKVSAARTPIARTARGKNCSINSFSI